MFAAVAPLTLTAIKAPTVRGYLYSAGGRLCGMIESFKIRRNTVTFETIPSSLQFHANRALSHVALVYKDKTSVLVATSGFAKDGVCTVTIEHMVTLPSPECPGLRLPSTFARA